MSTRSEVREFLTTRRARITPAMAGVTDFGTERRVPGLRRAEVAALAGVSVEYYTRLERGDIAGASDGVLDGIADALQLDDVERAHLHDLARNAAPAPVKKRRQAEKSGVPASVQRVLDGMDAAVIVYDTRQNLVAANALGRALYAPHFDTDGQPNIARFVYLDSRAKDFYVDYALARRTLSAIMRMDAGRNPLDAELTAVIGELSVRSPEFRTDWARHDVKVHTHGVKEFRHPEVGVIEFEWDVFQLPAAPGLSIVSYPVQPGTVSAERMALLASWAATDGS